MRTTNFSLYALAGFGLLMGIWTPALAESRPSPTSTWHTDYTTAVKAAKEQGKFLLIHFHETRPNAADVTFTQRTLAETEVRRKLDAFECASLPLDASILMSGRQTRLVDHPSFAELGRRQGIAILDFACPGTVHYGQVVNVIPFKPGRSLSAGEMRAVLTLPPGTLTQRTIIYAVRTHPEQPASTNGQFNPVLADEAASHSSHQASIRVQGHHGWGYRFQRILSRLRFGGAPVEVVAESWPGQGLVEAAEDCVQSWRQSSGHWDAVRTNHGAYAYDMKRGANGVWYATGIFAGFRR